MNCLYCGEPLGTNEMDEEHAGKCPALGLGSMSKSVYMDPLSMTKRKSMSIEELDDHIMNNIMAM
jgi:hypothetical protein